MWIVYCYCSLQGSWRLEWQKRSLYLYVPVFFQLLAVSTIDESNIGRGKRKTDHLDHLDAERRTIATSRVRKDPRTFSQRARSCPTLRLNSNQRNRYVSYHSLERSRKSHEIHWSILQLALASAVGPRGWIAGRGRKKRKRRWPRKRRIARCRG